MPHSARSVELIGAAAAALRPLGGSAGRRRWSVRGVPGRCRGGRLARVHGAAGDIPAVVVTGMAGRQRRACPADGQDRHRRYEQQLMRQRPAAWLHAQRYPPG